MSDLFVSVTVDIGKVEEGFDAMERRAGMLGDAFRQLKKPMRADQRSHSKQKEGPDGAWPARKRLGSGTKKARRRNARKLLGRLPNAIVVKSYRSAVVAQSRASWSSVHQEGGRVGRGAVVPRRQFLWISDELLKTAADVVGEHVVEAF